MMEKWEFSLKLFIWCAWINIKSILPFVCSNKKRRKFFGRDLSTDLEQGDFCYFQIYRKEEKLKEDIVDCRAWLILVRFYLDRTCKSILVHYFLFTQLSYLIIFKGNFWPMYISRKEKKDIFVWENSIESFAPMLIRVQFINYVTY